MCIKQDMASTDDRYKKELNMLITALETGGSKGEVKVAEWIRDSALSWTERHDKNSLSLLWQPLWSWHGILESL